MGKFYRGKECRHGHGNLRYQSNARCVECLRLTNKRGGKAANAKYRQKKPERVWASWAINRVRQRAKHLGIAFDLVADDLLEILPTRCPVFGTKFSFQGNKVSRDESPSIDRLDPALGYVKGNIVVISYKANLIKSAYNSGEILMVGKWLGTLGY